MVSTELPLKYTPLESKHAVLLARMGEFAGWNMPIRYPQGIIAEHRHTREKVSLFDICHMGEFRISGRNAAAGLERLLPRKVVDQKIGTCRYNFLLTEQGTVRDDLLVYRMSEHEFYLVVNAGTAPSDAEWLRQELSMDTIFVDESAETAKLDLQGPLAFEVLSDLGVEPAMIPRYYRWVRAQLCGCNILLSRTGYTGERGVELYFRQELAPSLWEALLQHPLVEPAGLGARDTLRLEMGYPLYGHELNLETTPVEAGFGRLLHLEGREFVGADVLRQPPNKRLAGFALEGRRAARAGATVWSVGGQEIGFVTSGAYGPSIGKAIALGFIHGKDEPPCGMQVKLGVSFDKAIPAKVTPLPFRDSNVLK